MYAANRTLPPVVWGGWTGEPTHLPPHTIGGGAAITDHGIIYTYHIQVAVLDFGLGVIQVNHPMKVSNPKGASQPTGRGEPNWMTGVRYLARCFCAARLQWLLLQWNTIEKPKNKCHSTQMLQRIFEWNRQHSEGVSVLMMFQYTLLISVLTYFSVVFPPSWRLVWTVARWVLLRPVGLATDSRNDVRFAEIIWKSGSHCNFIDWNNLAFIGQGDVGPNDSDGVWHWPGCHQWHDSYSIKQKQGASKRLEVLVNVTIHTSAML